MTTTGEAINERATDARTTLQALFWVGLFLNIGGTVGAALAWPSVSAYSGEMVGGSLPFAILCAVAAGAGALMLAVAIVGYGVKLGLAASRE